MGIGRDISFCCDRDHTSYLIIYNRLTSYLAVPQVRLSLNERCKKLSAKQRILKTWRRQTCRKKCTERKQRSDRRGSARRAVSVDISCQLEDTRAFQFAIRIDSIRFVMRIDSNRFVLEKKSAFRFTSCYAVFARNK